MTSSVQEEIMDLDLNQHPSSDSESPFTELSPWLNDLETTHEHIEERIRQLESIVSRIRERETTTTITSAIRATTPPPIEIPDEHRGSTAGVIHERSRERIIENGEGDSKKYLIAKALNMEKTSSVPGGYFDCNVCLDKAEDPILTCCGHLFCWGCFYQLPLIYLNIKECPVCDGEVTDAEVIPIYGNGDDCDGTKPKLESCGICLPPRPIAKRVESVRQKIINRSIPFIPVHETSEHIRSFDSIGLQALAESVNDAGDSLRLLSRQLHHNRRPSFGPLRLLPPHMPPFVFDNSETDDDNAAFDVDSLVDTPNLRRNRRRSARIAEIGPSPAVRGYRNNNNVSSQTISFGVDTAGSSSPREFAVPGPSVATRSQTVNPTEVVTLASSSRRRTEDLSNGPRTRSRRRLR